MATMEDYGNITKFPGFAFATSPKDVVEFFDDFVAASVSATVDIATWHETIVGSATGFALLDPTDGNEDEGGGVLALSCQGTADDIQQIQANGEAFHLDGSYPLIFQARINFTDVSNIEFFIGIAQTNTDVATTTTDNEVGFRLTGGVLKAVTSDGSGNTKVVDCGITEADNDWIRVGFIWDGTDLAFWVDTNDDGTWDKHVSTRVAATTADFVPQAIMMSPAIGIEAGTTDAAQTILVDYIYCSQKRFAE